MWKRLQERYWSYMFHMEIERGIQLDRIYLLEKERISAMKHLALRKLNDLTKESHEAYPQR